jgi:dTDP-4-dehydrorhamnose reductase
LKVLITGAGGLVGASQVSCCSAAGDDVVAHTHQSLDICDAQSVERTVAESNPDAIINCAAWTDVDGCEFDHERAFLVNAHGPENLARASRQVGATFVTISTDYVFDGAKEGFYTQHDEPNPQSVYGASKLEGERRARESNPQAVIVRTGFVFGRGGKNFLSTIVDRARRGERMRAISDARGTPTYAPDLALRLRQLALRGLPEVFHVVNSGNGASYVDFARLALRAAGADEQLIEPASTSSLNRPATRPANSCLRCLVSESIGLAPMRDWEDAVIDFTGAPALAESVAPAPS